MNQRRPFFSVLVFGGLLAFPDIAAAGNDVATFESFYRSSSVIYWIAGAALAVAAGVLIFFTGGAATGPVAAVGTWVGGLMGYSGAAATSAGLAFLGGGAVTAGGFGMVGGVALLTAAFSFTTSVVFDYAGGEIHSRYEYSKFSESSAKMTSLPLPKNNSGSPAFKAAMAILSNADEKESLSSGKNRKVIEDAIAGMEAEKGGSVSTSEAGRNLSLLSLLYFSINDYPKSKQAAFDAHRRLTSVNIIAPLPAFTLAVSRLYDETPDVNNILELFDYSITVEPSNPLTPLLYAVFLDRIGYRFNDGFIKAATLDKIYRLSAPVPYDERKAAIQLGLLSRFFMQTKLEQQRILSLAASQNSAIKESVNTVTNAKAALNEYKILLASVRRAIDEQSGVVSSRLASNPGWTCKLRGTCLKQWESEWNLRLLEMRRLWASYNGDIGNLDAKINELVRYQAELVEKRRVETEQGERRTQIMWMLIALLAVVTIVVVIAVMAKRAPR